VGSSICLGGVVDNLEAQGGAIEAYTTILCTGCRADTLVAFGNAYGFFNCDNSPGNTADNVSSTNGTAFGFNDCDACSGNTASNISSAGNVAYGFNACNRNSGSTATSISSSANSAYVFLGCTNVSGCRAYDIKTSINNALYKAVGFQDCNQLSACTADTIAASAANAYSYGFNNCDRVSACHATTVTASTASRAYGFNDCDWMDGSNEATAIDDFEFYDCSNEPFKGIAAATPYGYSELYSSQAILNGSTITVTPTKDGILFGYLNQPTGSRYANMFIRNGNSGKSPDVCLNTQGTYIPLNSFSLPVKTGISVYFTVASDSSSNLSIRFMPFGTTT